MAFSFASGAASEPLPMEFADGTREIPVPYVVFMGGKDKLLEIAEDLKGVNYADFEYGVLEQMNMASLAKLGKAAQLKRMKQRSLLR